jgi:uroporphyrinogen decarboxylase
MSVGMTPRDRVKVALSHQEPDRVPADFAATPEVWDKLIAYFRITGSDIGLVDYLEAAREALLRHFEIDARVMSYDMFCAPPESILHEGANVDWWTSLDRSTPNRMWRQRNPDATYSDIWGVHRRRIGHKFGAYEEIASWPLQDAGSVSDLKSHSWPEPDWWDFNPLPEIVRQLDAHEPYHIRFRIGSVFEIAWQLRGMQLFLMDLVANPEMSRYIMSRLADVHMENTRRVLELLGDRLDMVYLYDDVATQTSLMISPDSWRAEVKPHYTRLVELAHSRGVPVMYHCDGAIYPLIPELIELGIDVLNPIQPDLEGMDPRQLKSEFGERLVFHGGIDIVRLLSQGTPEQVIAEVLDRVDVLGESGGYILCSAHHIQPDTPVENIVALYDVALRYRNRGRTELP